MARTLFPLTSAELSLAKWLEFPRLIGSFVDMILSSVNVILALGQPPGQPGQQQAPVWLTMAPMILLIVVFYIALIRPQQKKAKEHAELLKSIRPKDKVVTSGGILAEVITVKEKSVMVRSADSKFEITKSSIAEITERGGETSSS